MASLVALTRMLTLNDQPAQAHTDTHPPNSPPHRPTLFRINTDLAPPGQHRPEDDLDSSTPPTPVFLSAFPSPASEPGDDPGLAPVYTLNFSLQTATNVHLQDDYTISDDSSSQQF